MASGLGGVRASTLVSRVREAANMEASQSGSSQFVTDEEIKQRVDEAAGELYEKLITALGEDYFVKSAMVTVSPPASTFVASYGSLNADTYRVLSVHFLTNAEAVEAGARPVFVKCEPFQRADMTHLLNAQPSIVGPFRYRLSAQRQRITDDEEGTATTRIGDRIEIWPQLSDYRDFRVEYIPWFATFDATTEGGDGSPDTFLDADPVYPGIMGWEEWVVLKVAIYCKDKEESDSSKLELRLSEQTQRILDFRGRRDEGAPERVVLTRKRRKQGWYP